MLEFWHDGWVRDGDKIFYGNTSHCAGCGKIQGSFTVVIPDDYVPPPEPRWPFEQDTCPVCVHPKDATTDWKKNKESFAEFVRRTKGENE